MKYNCLRINPYVKMFVVGLLLYFGEAVFFKCGEEGTFTVKVNTISNDIIEVRDCKGSERLSDFIEKFEKAYAEKIHNVDFKKISYNLLFRSTTIVSGGNPNEDKTLAELEIDKNPCLYVVSRSRNTKKRIGSAQLMVTNEGKEYNTTEKNEDPATSTCPCSRVCRLCGC